MAASTGRDHLLRTRVDRFTRMLHGVRSGDVRAVHRTRVASRRLREVLPVLQLDAALAAKLVRRLRKVTDRLGPVRELDALLGLIDELRATDRYPAAGLERVAAAVRADRDRARARLASTQAIAELGRLGARLEKVARSLEDDERDRRRREASARARRWAIEARAARRASALRDAMATAGIVYQPDRLHAVRIAAKKLRYALEVAADDAGRTPSADLRLLRRVQDALGRLHDLDVLVQRARRLQAALAVPDVTLWRQLDALVVQLEDECRRLHAKYMRDREALAQLALRVADAGHSIEDRPAPAGARRPASARRAR